MQSGVTCRQRDPSSLSAAKNLSIQIFDNQSSDGNVRHRLLIEISETIQSFIHYSALSERVVAGTKALCMLGCITTDSDAYLAQSKTKKNAEGTFAFASE
ncbi:MAG: hypothetical protein JXN63_00100 [Candidatus Delongbacteria bacterium]|nr:hypothetical protein [Candidatus Delongbacteria bacterium]